MSPANRPKLLRCRWCCTELRLLQAKMLEWPNTLHLKNLEIAEESFTPKICIQFRRQRTSATSAPRRNSKAWRPEQKQKTWRTKFSSILESLSGLTCKAVSKLPQPKPSTNRCSKRFTVEERHEGVSLFSKVRACCHFLAADMAFIVVA